MRKSNSIPSLTTVVSVLTVIVIAVGAAQGNRTLAAEGNDRFTSHLMASSAPRPFLSLQTDWEPAAERDGETMAIVRLFQGAARVCLLTMVEIAVLATLFLGLVWCADFLTRGSGKGGQRP